MTKIALLTCDALLAGLTDHPDTVGHFTDDALLLEPLRREGFEPEFVSWSGDRDWSQYACAIIRSTWDYTKRLGEFLTKLEKIASQTRLWNPLPLIQWNARKNYLLELADKGISTLPTRFLEVWDFDLLRADLEKYGGIVVKPVVGAGSKGAFYWRRGQEDFSRLEGLALPYLVQPLIEEVRNGEYSLHFMGGELSHAIRKIPKAGDYRSQEEYGSDIRSYEPSTAERDFCEQVFAAIPPEPWLYARVDYVRLKHGPALMELELIEPSLYLRFGRGAPEVFARALKRQG